MSGNLIRLLTTYFPYLFLSGVFMIRFAFVTLLLASSSAFAADLTASPIEPAPPVFSWSGFYVGAHAGVTDSTVRTNGPHSHFDNTGASGGIHAGYQWHFGSHVIAGLDGDVDYTDLTKLHESPASKFENNWQGSVRAKAGYAAGRFLPYIAAGMAVANPELSGWEAERKTLVGWTAGGGLDYALDQHWLVRGDIRYTDFGKQDFPFADGMTAKVRLSAFSSTLGLSYKF
jgi:outer membrane immunogenic protein